VGEEPHESQGQEGAESNQSETSEMQMQPAKSLDDALNMARDIFSSGAEDAGAQSAFEGAYNKTAGMA